MNTRADYIIPECFVDTNLIETLACPAGCNHQKGCNQVAKVMKEKFADRFAIGIIDADKRRPTYLDEFSELAASKHLRLLRHNVRHHFIILVYPAIDRFILSCAEVANLTLSKYGLPSELHEFTAQTKNVMSNKDLRFKCLFKDMESTGEIKLLKTLLSYLCDKTFQASSNELKSIFSLS